VSTLHFSGAEHDACGLWASVQRDGRPAHHVIDQAIRALQHMSHRAGSVSGEGDGAGLMIDLPRGLWAAWLEEDGRDPGLTRSSEFGIGHFLLSPEHSPETLREAFHGLAVRILMVRRGAVVPGALGAEARAERLSFWQVAFLGALTPAVLERLWSLEAAGVAVLSWSHDTVVYKLRGHAEDLPRYFRDLTEPAVATTAVLGHVRYSTNTTTRAHRAQPFRLLGHNGEINTIARLRKLAADLGFSLPDGGSDSQDLSRLAEALMVRDGLSLAEVVALLFPPAASLVEAMPPEMATAWSRLRAAAGPVAQGPAAILARAGKVLLASQDALGLRPLWLVETPTQLVISSESGAMDLEWVRMPDPLGPGEKLAVSWDAGHADILRSPDFEAVMGPALKDRLPVRQPEAGSARWEPPPPVLRGLGASGWETQDTEMAEAMAEGRDPIGSLGIDTPLPALEAPGHLADYLQETVAVVTNPAIDRERESIHFSTEAWLGARPWFGGAPRPEPVHLFSPLMADTWRRELGPHASGLDSLPLPHQRLDAFTDAPGSVGPVLERLARDAVHAVRAGAVCLILDDQPTDGQSEAFPLDPALAAATVARALESVHAGGQSLRRQTGIIMRSALIRRLHDVAVVLGVGADAVLPYRFWQEAERLDGEKGLAHASKVLREGLEKVLSTMGIHELAGYGPVFSAIGISPDLAALLEVPLMVEGSTDRDAIMAGIRDRWQHDVPVRRPYHLYPKLFKLAEAAARSGDVSAYTARLGELERERPLALRHLLDVRPAPLPPVPAERVSLQIGEHRLPFVIGSMSFGSQGETAYRAYLKAAAMAGMLAMNGEGGEIPDLVTVSRAHRGIQVASGRFGILAEVVASARYLEIKIGQGAKPGEGGHLPARKVSAAVAAARRSQPGVDLISPANNHDLYSIEDLAELIYELKTVAPAARVAVKVPVVPNIGTIAVGIAKAGADIINLSGYEGGTGAARRHAQRHVGLPSDVGTVLVHRALVEAGLRSRVEIWADGGMRGPDDALKQVLLGANRVGFGTLAMVAAGCTICRGCQTDTCHVGIATQIRTAEEAARHGLRRFVPRDLDHAASQIASLFEAFGRDLAARAGSLHVRSLQDLVGLGGHLRQARGQDLVDLTPWLIDVPVPRTHSRTRPLTVDSNRRALGVAEAGQLVRQEVAGSLALETDTVTDVVGVAGQGLAAFHTARMVTRVLKGAQDGVAKAMSGGTVIVLGPVGKSLAYGATGGRLMVAGPADTRALIRFSGGEALLGAWPDGPVDGSLRRAALKGYAFEYMTGGLAVTLGDPGPWICAGMTGGAVVCLLHPELGLDRDAIHRRVAPGAKVRLVQPVPHRLWAEALDLVDDYAHQLGRAGRLEEADRVQAAALDAGRWLVILPNHAQADPSISTE
jgi:glutamate synthase (NADPH/NADH) large chain